MNIAFGPLSNLIRGRGFPGRPHQSPAGSGRGTSNRIGF